MPAENLLTLRREPINAPSATATVALTALVIAGWTGRERGGDLLAIIEPDRHVVVAEVGLAGRIVDRRQVRLVVRRNSLHSAAGCVDHRGR